MRVKLGFVGGVGKVICTVQAGTGRREVMVEVTVPCGVPVLHLTLDRMTPKGHRGIGQFNQRGLAGRHRKRSYFECSEL